jgi:hypothetical protein
MQIIDRKLHLFNIARYGMKYLRIGSPRRSPALGGKLGEGALVKKAMRSREATSAEHDADSVLFAPDGAAGQMQSIAGHNQDESRGYPGFVRYFQRRSGDREIADQAIDGRAAGLDRAGLQDQVARRPAAFVHPIKLRANRKEPVKEGSSSGKAL